MQCQYVLTVHHFTLSLLFFFPDVDGKVIHLVERAPPQTPMSGPGEGGVSTGGAEAGSSGISHPSTSSQGTPHERNGNSYVMLGTFNLPVNIMDPQQIQVEDNEVKILFWKV